MNIRQAVPDDSRRLSFLCTDVQSLHADHHPEIFKAPANDDFAVAFFDEALVDPAVRIFIGEADEDACGYILCRAVERPETPFTYALRYLLVDQISVRPSARGMGIGRALLERAEELARELELTRIQLDSWGFNLPAHGFFERLGFQKFFFRFWHDL